MKAIPILITGCARSGTSMTAGIIDICGAFGGRTSGPTKYNKKGMFENGMIRNNIVKPYLRHIGADPLGQDPLPKLSQLVSLRNLREQVVMHVCAVHGYKGGHWYYKGAKMCLMWPIWHDAFQDAKWIIVRRSDEGIINSCMKTGFMSRRTTPESWQEWIDTHKARFQEMKEKGLQIREVWPTKFIEGDFSEIQSVIEWLDLEWKDSEVREFIDPTLWSETNGKSNTN